LGHIWLSPNVQSPPLTERLPPPERRSPEGTTVEETPSRRTGKALGKGPKKKGVKDPRKTPL